MTKEATDAAGTFLHLLQQTNTLWGTVTVCAFLWFVYRVVLLFKGKKTNGKNKDELCKMIASIQENSIVHHNLQAGNTNKTNNSLIKIEAQHSMMIGILNNLNRKD